MLDGKSEHMNGTQ